MMIDFQSSRMFVIPVASAIGEPFPRDRSGLRAVQDGTKLVVRYVSEGSPAEAAGWKPGDSIVAVDGTRIGPRFPSSQLSLWAWRPAGTVVKLSMADEAPDSSRLLTIFELEERCQLKSGHDRSGYDRMPVWVEGRPAPLLSAMDSRHSANGRNG
jgi:hypothetical protein